MSAPKEYETVAQFERRCLALFRTMALQVSMPPSFNLEHRHLSVMLQAVLNSDPSVRLAANDSRVKTVQMIWNRVLACVRTEVAKQARTAVQEELVTLLVA